MSPKISLPAKPRILVVTLRRLGDVLLTTPLIRSLRRAWPDAAIDVLVFEGTAAIVAGNPDIDRVIAMPARPSAGASLALLGRLFKRYDLAISTQPGDRPTFFTILAGRSHAGLFDADGPAFGRAIKRFLSASRRAGRRKHAPCRADAADRRRTRHRPRA
jgi:heptosyltransferase-3